MSARPMYAAMCTGVHPPLFSISSALVPPGASSSATTASDMPSSHPTYRAVLPFSDWWMTLALKSSVSALIMETRLRRAALKRGVSFWYPWASTTALAEHSVRTTFSWPSAQAHASAVTDSLFFTSKLTESLIRCCTMLSRFKRHATIKGVSPSALTASLSAPHASRYCTIWRCPNRVATISGVSPVTTCRSCNSAANSGSSSMSSSISDFDLPTATALFLSASALMRCRTTARSPRRHATCSTDSPPPLT
mmetsp:Transcript_29204/g.87564  ORF Transcript_29204/g.87564 Transcript_29204/m.87564 type:complete len:251 (+) Transcript_29204:933-1685(+)